MKRYLALTAVLLLFLGLNVYVGWNGFVYLDWAAGGGIWPILYWCLFALIALGYLIGRMKALPGPLGRLLKVIGAYYFALFEYAVLLLPIADIAGWLMVRAGMDESAYIGIPGSAVLAVIILLLIRGGYNAFSPVVRTYALDVDKEAGGLERLRIIAASDIHLGNIVGNRHLRKLVGIVSERRPDLVLLPGDVIDDDIEPFVRNRMEETIAQLQAKHGVYAVLGNHEYYGGHIEEYVQRMAAIGIRVLRDETVDIEGGVQIAGRKDKTAEGAGPEGRLPVDALLRTLHPEKPIIVMDHQPLELGAASEAGADLLLCGHTHRGQFAPNHWITKRLFELDWGYLRKGQMHALVSSGFGTWGPPVRIASRSEVLDITITFRQPATFANL